MLRAAPTTTRVTATTIESAPWMPARAASPTALEPSEARETGPTMDWSGVREGIREVVLTLAATLAIGFAWAGIEMERLSTTPTTPMTPAKTEAVHEATEAFGVASLETGDPATQATGR